MHAFALTLAPSTLVQSETSLHLGTAPVVVSQYVEFAHSAVLVVVVEAQTHFIFSEETRPLMLAQLVKHKLVTALQ
jgi:hypothetical protein